MWSVSESSSEVAPVFTFSINTFLNLALHSIGTSLQICAVSRFVYASPMGYFREIARFQVRCWRNVWTPSNCVLLCHDPSCLYNLQFYKSQHKHNFKIILFICSLIGNFTVLNAFNKSNKSRL